MDLRINKIIRDVDISKDIYVVSIKSECGYQNITLTEDELLQLTKKVDFITGQEDFTK